MTPVFNLNNFVFVKNHLLRSTSNSNAEAMRKKVYNKLQPRTAGPFRIIAVRERALMIGEHGILQIVSIDRLTDALETIDTNHQHSHKQLRNKIHLKQESSQKGTAQEQ